MARFIRSVFPVLAVLLLSAGIVTAVLSYISVSDGGRIPAGHLPRIVSDWRDYVGSDSSGTDGRMHVTLLIYADYQCPFSAVAASAVEELTAAFPDRVKVVWRHYPFMGPHSLDAALASECARELGYFREMHEILFARPNLIAGTWMELASEIGVQDLESFSECMSDQATRAAVDRDLEAATALGISGTPTILLDSLLFRGTPSRRYLRWYVRSQRAT